MEVVDYGGGQVNGLVEGTFIGPNVEVDEGIFAPELAIGQIDVTLEFPGEGGENGFENGFEFVPVAELKELFFAIEIGTGEGPPIPD